VQRSETQHQHLGNVRFCEGSDFDDSRDAVRNPVLLVGVKNFGVECGKTGFLESCDFLKKFFVGWVQRSETQHQHLGNVRFCEGSDFHDSRDAVRNPVLLVGVKNCGVECGETGFLESWSCIF
jgi:uncharacterized ferredoxin-like protein